jgi:hypothetical protein
MEKIEIRSFNKLGYLAWMVSGKLLRQKRISKLTLKLFDKTVWLWRRIDPVLPWPGLTLLAVATKKG